MRRASVAEMLKALDDGISLDRMMELFPDQWRDVDRSLDQLFARNNAAELGAFMTQTREQMHHWRQKMQNSPGDAHLLETALSHLLRGRMAFEALNLRLHALLGQNDHRPQEGLSRYNHFLAKKVLRLSAVKSLPPPAAWMRFFWHLVTQKGTLISLLAQSGTYAVFTGEFIHELAFMLRGAQALEVGAGDGALAKFLKMEGIDIIPTDDYSWSHKIRFGAHVLKLEAGEALKQFAPSLVLCSWPPPGNTFERLIFNTKSVMTYIVIGSRHPFATADRDAYKDAGDTFSCERSPSLENALFPPDLDHEVLIFRRKS